MTLSIMNTALLSIGFTLSNFKQVANLQYARSTQAFALSWMGNE